MRESNIKERMEAFKDMFKEIGELIKLTLGSEADVASKRLKERWIRDLLKTLQPWSRRKEMPLVCVVWPWPV